MTEELKDNVKTDKRKQTSGKNLAKAREAKLTKLKQEKKVAEKVPQYTFEESDSSSSSSDSEDERIVVKKEKKKTKKVTEKQPTETLNEMAAIKGMLEQLMKKPKRSKPKKSKQVVQVITPPAQEAKKPSPEIESLKKRILLNFN